MSQLITTTFNTISCQIFLDSNQFQFESSFNHLIFLLILLMINPINAITWFNQIVIQLRAVES